MGLFVRKNASRNEKIYTRFMVFLMGCSIFGSLTDFHPIYTFIWSWPTWIGIFSISAILTAPLLLDTNPSRKLLYAGPLKKALYYFTAYIACSAIIFGFVGLFLPSIYTSAFGEPFSNSAEVIKKSYRHEFWQGGRGRGCRIRIYTDLIDGKICVSQRLYYSIEAGDNVIIEGLASGFGHKLFRVRKYYQTGNANPITPAPASTL